MNEYKKVQVEQVIQSIAATYMDTFHSNYTTTFQTDKSQML